jgi:hypothetical protein
MLGSLISVAAVAAVGQVYSVGAPNASDRPIATIAPYPAGMADDVHRPGFNGRMWVSRPIIGGMKGPYPLGWPSPGPEAYGAFDNQDAVVYAKSGHLIVPITPWVRIEPQGLKQLRRAQGFWLREHGYTGGVRTFVNDLYVWDAEDVKDVAMVEPRAEAPAKNGDALPEPVIKFELPAEMPRRRNRIRVEATDRVSWPLNAPAAVVARGAPAAETVVAEVVK